jgi:chromosomal replication initiation ATPase DnaA
MYYDDKKAEVRPTNTFDNFEVQSEGQRLAFDLLSTLAEQVVAASQHIASIAQPFDEPSLLFLWGQPGRGKTHLVEAFVNRIRVDAPEVYKRLIMSRGRFSSDFQSDFNSYGDAPIVIIDDMYHDMMRVSDLHPATEIKAFMRFITDLYDRRRMVIVTSNFPLIEGGIMEMVTKVDKIGRITSRAAEVMSRVGEIELQGMDFRHELVRRRRQSPGRGFSIALPGVGH